MSNISQRLDEIEQRQRLYQAAVDSLLRGQEETIKLLKSIAQGLNKQQQQQPSAQTVEKAKERETTAAAVADPAPAQEAAKPKRERRQKSKEAHADPEEKGKDEEAEATLPRPGPRRRGMFNAMMPTEVPPSPIKAAGPAKAKTDKTTEKPAQKVVEATPAQLPAEGKKPKKQRIPRCSECKSTENCFASTATPSAFYCAECWAKFGSCDACPTVSISRADLAIAHFTGQRHIKKVEKLQSKPSAGKQEEKDQA